MARIPASILRIGVPGETPVDLRVRELADGISGTQVREIKEMTWLVKDIAANGPATTAEAAAQRAVPSFDSQ